MRCCSSCDHLESEHTEMFRGVRVCGLEDCDYCCGWQPKDDETDELGQAAGGILMAERGAMPPRQWKRGQCCAHAVWGTVCTNPVDQGEPA